MNKVKILFDANPLIRTKSGVGYFIDELVTQLSKTLGSRAALIGFYFNFFNRKTTKGLPTGSNISYAQSTVIPGKSLNITRRLGFQIPLELFSKRRADVVLFTNFVSLPLITKAVKVVMVYDVCFVDCPEFVASRNASFLKRWVPQSIQKADLIVTISEFTKKRIAEVYSVPESKIHVMPIPPHTPAKPDISILTKHGLKDGRYLLFVGTLEPRKNIVNLLDAYSQLPEHMKAEYPLVLVGGKGWNDHKILAALTDLDRKGTNVICTSYVTNAEKAALYEGSTAVIQPSHYEGFGMPVLEAMSYGKPILCSDIAVFHEVGGDAPLFFDKNKPSDIADVITQMLKDPKIIESASKKSRQRVRDFPTWQAVTKSFWKRLDKEIKLKNE